MTISIPTLLAFTLAMLILAATPGPSFFALTARSITNGAVAGVGVVTGIIIADLIYFVLALIGMTALSGSIGSAFLVIKVLAGGYLIWLGVQMWRRKPIDSYDEDVSSARGFFKNLVEGLLVNLTNPKAILFFAALLPTFVDLPSITAIDAFVLSLIVVFVGGTTDLAYVFMATKIRGKLKGQRTQKILNRIGGATLCGVGAVVVTR